MSPILYERSQHTFWQLGFLFPVSFVCIFFPRVLMAGPFRLYTIERSGGVRLPSPPEKILEHRFDKKAWHGYRITREKKNRKGKRIQVLPKSIEETVFNENPDPCLQCKKIDDDDCGIECVEKFRRRKFFRYRPRIQPSGSFGYGAFNTGRIIPAKRYLSEYLGDLIPSDNAPRSLYLLDIKGLFSIDAGQAGNWTRYINSCCEPNLQAEPALLGKRHVLVFETLRRILPGEELTFYYGRKYFKQAGFKCSCPWRAGPHTPRKTEEEEEEENEEDDDEDDDDDDDDDNDGNGKGKSNRTNTGESPDVSTGEDTEQPVTPPTDEAAPQKPAAKGKKRAAPQKKTETVATSSSSPAGSPSGGKKVSSGRVTKKSR
ncbi:Histone-lysine N-methyltransferase trithorax [Pseudocercospora fuligena]|uniref:Histone-lysine N-methyltransferase trithorax n=1 Tax=Pseudocercospora fuligena TaxID=685502 RepID=A0A8H6RNC8_9PEZI|nr:Histone-lysine N-methyltransferase trithorax [Pseudocercospora fuligena]